MAHSSSDDLEPLISKLRNGWRKVGSDYLVRKLRADFGCAPMGWLHVTFGASTGWHPHLHGLMLSDRELSAEESERMGRAVVDAYRAGSGETSPQSSWFRESSNPGKWVEYVRKSAQTHYSNECGGYKHTGCSKCKPKEDFDLWADKFDDDWNRAMPSNDPWESFPKEDPRWTFNQVEGDVFTGLGRAAVAGDRRAQAKLAEFVQATGRLPMVPNTRAVASKFGAVPLRDDLWEPADGVEVDSSLWGSAQLRGVNMGVFRRLVLADDLSGLADLVGCRVTQKNGFITTPELRASNIGGIVKGSVEARR